MNAREEVLERVRAAIAGAPPPAPAVRDYSTGPSTLSRSELVELLADRLVNYKAVVHRADADGVSAAVTAAARARGASRVVVAPGLPARWHPSGLELLQDDPPLSVTELDAVDGVLTTCRVAIAETGTLVLDAGPGQGRRVLTLVPDWSVVVVRESDIVEGVPEAVALLTPTAPLTWVSGPSATSDIELKRVEGVHGPRTLEVVIVAD